MINGRRYDAASGHFTGMVKRVAASTWRPISNQTVDGVMAKPKALVISKSLAYKQRRLAKARRQSPAQVIHRRTQRPKTLMRQMVAKPKSLKSLSSPLNPLRKRVAKVTPAKLYHAQSIAQNNKVRRFGIPKRSAHTPPATHHKLSVGEVLPKTGHLSIASTSSSSAAVATLPSVMSNASHQRLERLLDHALAKADAHKQALHASLSRQSKWHRPKFMPKWLGFALLLVSLLLIAGFFAWQNIPQVSMRITTLRSHINATIPSYIPDGFSFKGPIHYQNGSVSMQLKANSDSSRTIELTQQPSNWDSASLAASAVPAGAQLQTSQVKDTTVYIYGDRNDATWVSNGIRYILKDKAQLNSDQVLRMADSL